MDQASQFFSIFLATVLLVRIFLYFKPISSPTIAGIRLHHWMFGVVGMPVALLIHSIPLYALSLGVFVDELPFLLMGGKNHKDNYSWLSVSGVVVLCLLVVLFKETLLLPFF